MKKIAIAYGTRPELIKLVPIIKKMQQHLSIELYLINTGQHHEMVEEIEQIFDIKPSVNLRIMKHDQSLTDIMVKVASEVQSVVQKERFDIMLVQGDTSTASTVATVCFYNKVIVGHIEAGLRSFNMLEPFPEEFNRKLISIVADFNFTPTSTSTYNLLKEDVKASKIFEVGNTIVDMVDFVKRQFSYEVPGSYQNKILITAHRRENHGAGIKNICDAVKRVTLLFPDVRFTWPIHPNPNVVNDVRRELGELPNVTLTQPLSYLELTKELNSSKVIWTDSGGIQEECPSFKKPVLILRNVTERPEVVESGFGILVGTEVDKIVHWTKELFENDKFYNTMISGTNPFGNGDASEKIIQILMEKL